MAESVQGPTLDLGSGPELRVMRLGPVSGARLSR